MKQNFEGQNKKKLENNKKTAMKKIKTKKIFIK